MFSVLLGASLVDTYSNSEQKHDKRYFNGIKCLHIVNNIYNSLCFSNSKNIIILSFDSLDTFTFEKILELYPDMKPIFNSFYFFKENIGVGFSTREAFPQILSGCLFSKQKYGSFYEFIYDSLIGEESMAADAIMNGYKVFIDADYWQVSSNNIIYDMETDDQNFRFDLLFLNFSHTTSRNYLKVG